MAATRREGDPAVIFCEGVCKRPMLHSFIRMQPRTEGYRESMDEIWSCDTCLKTRVYGNRPVTGKTS